MVPAPPLQPAGVPACDGPAHGAVRLVLGERMLLEVSMVVRRRSRAWQFACVRVEESAAEGDVSQSGLG